MSYTTQYAAKLGRLCSEISDLLYRARQLEAEYWSTGVAEETQKTREGADALANTLITKDEMLAGVTFLQQFSKFMGNEAVVQGTYLTTVDKIKTVKYRSVSEVDE